MTANKRKLNYLMGVGTILLAGATAIPATASDFSGGYLGADIGGGRNKVTGDYSAPYKTTLAGGVEGGYNWDITDSGLLLGLDGFFAETREKSRTDSMGSEVNFGDRTYGVDGKIGFAMDKWLPYIKLGVGKMKGTGDFSDYKKNGTHLGLGAEYKIADHWSLGGELSRFKAKELDGVKGINNSLFLKLKYYFDSQLPVAAAPIVAAPVAAAIVEPPPAPKPAPKPAPRVERLTFQTSKLFAFDSDVLSQPQPKLDELARVLNENKQIDSVTINGYADRLGSEKYNLNLSQRRADAVKAFLVKQGVDVSRINAVGKGEADPVVECKEKNRAALITCLEPNRRIEVEQITYEKRID